MIVFTLSGAVLLIVGLILFGQVGRSLYLGWQSSSWPQVEGEIVRSQTSEINRQAARGSRPEIERIIDYVYEVKQQKYTSSRRSFIRTEYDADDTRCFYSGARIPVFYHPQKPDLSVLVTGLSESHRLLFNGLISLSFIFGGTSLVYIAVRYL